MEWAFWDNWPVKLFLGFRHWHDLPKFLRFDHRRGGSKSGGRQRMLPVLAISAVGGGAIFSWPKASDRGLMRGLPI
jgi:hypothetical protein